VYKTKQKDLTSLNYSLSQKVGIGKQKDWDREEKLCYQSINQAIDESMNQSMNQTMNQSMNQWSNGAINEEINESMNESINQKVNLRQVKCRERSVGRWLNDDHRVRYAHSPQGLLGPASPLVRPNLVQAVDDQCQFCF
jgi:hypothetical protein